MKIMLMTDIEGVTNLNDYESVRTNSGEGYLKACHELMYDINAAVEGFFEGGADTVYVVDGHSQGRNFIRELLHPKAIQLNLKDRSEWERYIKESLVDAYAEVGLHCMAGVENGFLDHTQCNNWFDYTINGVSCGELIQGAGFVGEYGIPMIFVSGDKALEEEAKRFIPGIATAVVKKAEGRNKAVSLPSNEARDLIRKTARDSIKLIGKIKPYKIKLPAEITITFTNTADCDVASKNRERIDGRTIKKTITKIEKYIDLI